MRSLEYPRVLHYCQDDHGEAEEAEREGVGLAGLPGKAVVVPKY